MRFVAGRCAEAELLAGQGAVTERHREAVAGRGTGAERHREEVAGRGAVAAEMLLSRTLLAEKSKAASRSCCWQRRRKAASGSSCWLGPPEWAITSLVRHA